MVIRVVVIAGDGRCDCEQARPRRNQTECFCVSPPPGLMIALRSVPRYLAQYYYDYGVGTEYCASLSSRPLAEAASVPP